MSPPLVLHLHAHLPECRPARLGGVDFEDWFFEALQGSYLPLLDVFEGWRADGVDARLSLSLSAPLLSMLDDQALLGRARDRWSACAELARALPLPEEVSASLAFGFERAITGSAHPLERLRRLEAEVVDVVATGASHALFPFTGRLDPRWTEAQVGIGLDRLRRSGFSPVGFWLPECGVDGDTEKLLARHHVPFSFVEGAEGIMGSPFQSEDGTVFFPRSLSVAREVWDPEYGCPGQGPYREFHRDAGRECEPDFVERFGLPGDGRPLNLKAWAVDGEFYSKERGEAAVRADAARFWRRRREEGGPAVAPFDAELFGHWWFEGPLFIDRLARDPEAGPVRSAADVLRAELPLPVRRPTPGTWGQHGFGRTWLGPDNAWIQDRVMTASARFFGLEDPEAQLARLPHMLGLMASDWPFVVRAGAYLDAVPLRVQEHFDAVMGAGAPVATHSGLQGEAEDLAWLRSSEAS